ncbi:hypothetical protein AN958_02094 [Leucoagaricus sp. SymC.cos]|nr:hypothetical protein AN958_02094 [Leucoagaricus sp. SymC.cos]
MALTQSARLPDLSWDEEVVPALRKRLENESRTLARRMSAISLSSNVDDNPPAAFNSNSTADGASIPDFQQNNHNHNNMSNGASGASSNSVSRWSRPSYQKQYPMPPADQHNISVASTSAPGASTSTSPRIANGTLKQTINGSFHRSRTYSQPFATPPMNGGIRQPWRTNTTNLDHASLASRSPRLVDAKPTRIPKASRGPPGSTTNASSSNMPFQNGASSGVSHSTTPTPVQTPNLNSTHTNEFKAYHFPTSHSARGFSQNMSMRIINEPAPFNTASSSSSIYNIHEEMSTDELGFTSPKPSRDSLDSMEERPFEHWYRGEVSRNGGVGELRVGKQQEMLDIANYGYAINNKRKLLASRQAALLAMNDSRRGSMRKRADSVAGFGRLGFGMKGRGSLYLDDDTVLDGIGRVLDEDPLTDIDGDEASDIASISTRGQQDRRPHRYSNHDTDYILGVGDIMTMAGTTSGNSNSSLPSPQSPPASYAEVEVPREDTPTQQLSTPMQPSSQPTAPATTPTQTPVAPASTPTPRSKSRQNSSSRIPTYERRSSESRTSVPSHHSSSTTKTGQQPNVVDLTSVSPSPSPSPPLPSTSTMGPSARAGPTPSTPSSAKKRGISPGPHNIPGSSVKKPRTPGSITPAKAKPKPKPAIKKFVKEGDNRRSVAHYPTPGNDDEDMADAIPSWTQPKIMPGNWDDVVLPVVARKKGLDDLYEKADGSPQPKKKEEAPIAPAPGTFGYDGTKNCRRGVSGEDIEMDDFGQPKPAPLNTMPDVLKEVELTEFLKPPEPILEEDPKTGISAAHNNIRVPVKPPPSPAPFAHYAPTTHYTPEIDFAKLHQEQQQAAVEQGEEGAGCCKCVVM